VWIKIFSTQQTADLENFQFKHVLTIPNIGVAK
jgi:hypothetical protein